MWQTRNVQHQHFLSLVLTCAAQRLKPLVHLRFFMAYRKNESDSGLKSVGSPPCSSLPSAAFNQRHPPVSFHHRSFHHRSFHHRSFVSDILSTVIHTESSNKRESVSGIRTPFFARNSPDCGAKHIMLQTTRSSRRVVSLKSWRGWLMGQIVRGLWRRLLLGDFFCRQG